MCLISVSVEQGQASYFEKIEAEVKKEYEIASAARAQGKDPETKVDIPVAEDVAARVEGLVGTIFPRLIGSGLKEGIRELEKFYGKNDDRVSLKVAEQVALGKFVQFESAEQALEAGVRVGTAYATLGVVTAPLEGISAVRIKNNYVSIYFAGPIRSAGGTAAAFSVLLADYLRRKLGIGEFKASKIEVKRYCTEINDYNRIQNLQYHPSEQEIALIVENARVCIDGDPTEEKEVSTHKDLSRIETNRIRGGMALVIGEGLASKASKILKKIRSWGAEFDFSNWMWIEELIKVQKARHAADKAKQSKYAPSEKYVAKVIAGRPVLAHPSRPGGFRLRYGRARTGGLAATAIHPATMWLLEFTALGTQLATELPGKATIATPCDSIEGPVVKLRDGSVVELASKSDAAKIRQQISKILSLGDVLIPVGEFLSNGQALLPSSYVEEWWALEVKEAIEAIENGAGIAGVQNIAKANISEALKESIAACASKPYPAPSAELAFEISSVLGVPLHPKYNFWWHDISRDELKTLAEYVASGEKTETNLALPIDRRKEILETLCVPHIVMNGKIVIDLRRSPIVRLLGNPTTQNLPSIFEKIDSAESTIKAISELAGVQIREKGLVRVGMKMGRPEKAERRLMEGRPQTLFPCGNQGGRMRNLMAAYEKGFVSAEFPIFKCANPACKKESSFYVCQECSSRTSGPYGFKKTTLVIKGLFDRALEKLGMREKPELVKGVKGVMGRFRHIEAIEKGLLRAKYDLYVNKDGTTRYDATNVGVTHFRPSEVGASVEKLRELGYTQDIFGRDLEREDQLLSLKPQDIIISDNEDFSAGDYFVKVANFVDELLEKFYGLQPFYNAKTKEDLLGHIVIGLAPHTSAGIVGRIIGFTPAKAVLAHPFWHAAKRRNLDGDEDSIMLLMDALLNFSRQFLPDVRGGRTMDAPLILATRLDPQEVDNEVWNMEVVSEYPIEFYRESWQYKYPWELSKKIKTVADCIGKADSIEIKFTHDTTDIADAPAVTKYVKLQTMEEKVDAQLDLAQKIRAVDADKVAESVLEKHFLRDIKGNLRTFGAQQVRCIDCNAKYRRPPLAGKCVECGGNLVLTVSEGTIRKYIEPAKRIIERHNISPYLIQQFVLLDKSIDALFGKRDRQLGLSKFA